MKRAFGLFELIIVIIVIAVVYFTCLKSGKSPIEEVVNESVRVKQQNEVINERLENIQNIRNIGIEREKQILDGNE